MFRAILLLVACLNASLMAAEPKAPKLLIFGIDGCRLDALQSADTPHLDELVRQGAMAENTQVVGPRETGSDTVSGPGWSSILTGVWADKHGVRDNKFAGSQYEKYPHFFKRLKDAKPDLRTVSLVNWEPIHTKIVAAADESLAVPVENKNFHAADVQIARRACELLSKQHPDALFVYLGDVDETGHAKGFHPTVPDYRRAIEQADALVGQVMAAVRNRASYAGEDWLVLVCTDHGGRGTGHGGGHDFPEVCNVFLIVSGPKAPKGKIEAPTFLVDVAATAVEHMGVRVQPEWNWDGKNLCRPGERSN